MNRKSLSLTRRSFVGMGIGLTAAQAWPQCSEDRLLTPHKYGKLVLSASGEAGAYDSLTVDCPFVFSHDDRFYMTFVAFDGKGYQTGLASSEDLVNWEKEGSILKRDPAVPALRYNVAMNWILRENDLYSPGRLVQVDGSFLGAYHAYPDEGLEQGAAVIGLCRSKDLLHWEAGPPVLQPSDGADWERGGLYKPCLLKEKDTYYLFYNAKNHTVGDWHEQTGVATSKDLKTWTRFAGSPVIRNGRPGSPDEHFASDPCILHDRAQWAFFYFGLDMKGVARDMVATSPTLLHEATCKRVVVDVGPPGSVDSAYAHKPSVIAYKGDLYHFYCAVSRIGDKVVRGISVARSRPWA